MLMGCLGDRRQAAAALQHVELSRGEARQVFDQLMGNIELWLAHNYIHADLSAYNVLYWRGKACIIDFPQVVDPRFNPNALALLTRDIQKIFHYAPRYGLEPARQRIAHHLLRKINNAWI